MWRIMDLKDSLTVSLADSPELAEFCSRQSAGDNKIKAEVELTLIECADKVARFAIDEITFKGMSKPTGDSAAVKAMSAEADDEVAEPAPDNEASEGEVLQGP